LFTLICYIVIRGTFIPILMYTVSDHNLILFKELIVGIIVLTSFIFIYYKYDSGLGKTEQGARDLGILIYKFDDAYIGEIALCVSFIGFVYLFAFKFPNPLVISGIIYFVIGYLLMALFSQEPMVKEVNIVNANQSKYYLAQWNYYFLYCLIGILFTISGLIAANLL
jgi:hypothetical protein